MYGCWRPRATLISIKAADDGHMHIPLILPLRLKHKAVYNLSTVGSYGAIYNTVPLAVTCSTSYNNNIRNRNWNLFVVLTGLGNYLWKEQHVFLTRLFRVIHRAHCGQFFLAFSTLGSFQSMKWGLWILLSDQEIVSGKMFQCCEHNKWNSTYLLLLLSGVKNKRDILWCASMSHAVHIV